MTEIKKFKIEQSSIKRDENNHIIFLRYVKKVVKSGGSGCIYIPKELIGKTIEIIFDNGVNNG